jgi:hypothetical protein
MHTYLHSQGVVWFDHTELLMWGDIQSCRQTTLVKRHITCWLPFQSWVLAPQKNVPPITSMVARQHL